MAKQFAFDQRAIGNSLGEMGLANVSFIKQLSEFVTFDIKSGSIDIDLKAVDKLAKKNLTANLVNPFLSVCADIANGGMAIFGDNSDIEKGNATAMPWSAISDLVYKLDGTPMAMRSALGIEKATSEKEVIKILQKKFGNFPDWMIEGGIPKLFLKDTTALPKPGSGGGGGGDNPPKPKNPPMPPPNSGSGGINLPPFDDAVAVARCFVNGKWGPLANWYITILGVKVPIGFAFGWQVCLDQACADKLANVLMGLGGGTTITGVVQQILVQGVSAALKGIVMTAGIALAIYGFLLGLNIKAVNWSKGVCLQGNWPIVGGPGALIWAVAGS